MNRWYWGQSADDEVIAITAGYEWRWPSIAFQLGGGLEYFRAPLACLASENGRCVEPLSPLLPALDLALRYRF